MARGLYKPEYQIVTVEDAEDIRKAMEGINADADLLVFLSKGAFRVGGHPMLLLLEVDTLVK